MLRFKKHETNIELKSYKLELLEKLVVTECIYSYLFIQKQRKGEKRKQAFDLRSTVYVSFYVFVFVFVFLFFQM